ncbi:MAG TPA: hypothetical protein VMV41_14585 [Cellulomonadaceae bacterium]|nr:hypothetical protein [Cellulomonadaceae bacterium]
MNTPTSLDQSWWMKVKRARQHLAVIVEQVDQLGGGSPRPIRVAEHHETDSWIYTAHLDLTIDPMLPVILGEFLYDLRSALDHIAAANVPAHRISKSQFPIFTDDIWQPVPDGSAFDELRSRRSKQRKDWSGWTQGMPEAVLDIIQLTQPHEDDSTPAGNPDNHALTILHVYQNADKHRELNIINPGIEDPHAIVTWPTGDRQEFTYHDIPAGKMLRDGGKFFQSHIPVKVDLSGTVRIAMARDPQLAHRELPGSLHALIEEVGCVLASIQDAMNTADPTNAAPAH